MKVLDHGEITLEKTCAEDLDVVNAARVSLHAQSSEMTERETGLIRFLMRNRHGTPFEHGYFRFRVKAPLFVFREWHRHRVGHSYNEWSARYSVLEPEFYIPDTVVGQVGKPGDYSYEEVDKTTASLTRAILTSSSEQAYDSYAEALANGVSKQQARLFLPVNIYSEMIWSCNPRSLMHFLSLRNSEHAQWEIRQYAVEAEKVFLDTMPVTAQLFVDGGRIVP